MIQSALRLMGRYFHVNWAIIDQTLVSGVNFLTGILLARYLGLEAFGRYTLVWMAVLFVNGLQNALIIQPMMSIGPKQTDTASPAYFGAVIVQQIGLSTLVFLLLLFGTQLSGVIFPEWRVEGLALPLACTAIAFQLQDFQRRYFLTSGKGATAVVCDAVAYLGRLGGLAWLFWWQASTDVAETLWIIAAAFAAAAVLGSLNFGGLEWKAHHWRAVAVRNWRMSRWLVASSLMQWGAGNFYLIAAASLMGASAVGGFRAAQNIIGVSHVLFLGLDNAVPPQASKRFFTSGRRALTSYLRGVAWLGGGATLALALLIAAVPTFWLDLVYGGNYVAYADILRWYALCYPIFFLGLPLRAGLRALEETKPVFTSYLLATAFSLATAYPLVGYFGLYGVVLGTLITQLLMQAVLWRGFTRHTRDAAD
jgi:O-antigen/teichoic acid export membrane protein